MGPHRRAGSLSDGITLCALRAGNGRSPRAGSRVDHASGSHSEPVLGVALLGRRSGAFHLGRGRTDPDRVAGAVCRVSAKVVVSLRETMFVDSLPTGRFNHPNPPLAALVAAISSGQYPKRTTSANEPQFGMEPSRNR